MSGAYGEKNKFPRQVQDENLTPQDVVDAFVEALSKGGFQKAMASGQDKFQTPFRNIPENAQSIDLRRVVIVPPASVNERLFNYTPPKGYEAVITGYALYSDAQFAAETEFVPKVNGARILPYHGTPTDINRPQKIPYRLSLGVAPDLSEISIIECNIRVTDTQNFEWFITNTSIVEQVMGVRFRGYIRPIDEQRSYNIGG